jgi:photosystem II stability/assembly factor-like uncharacterized protein
MRLYLLVVLMFVRPGSMAAGEWQLQTIRSQADLRGLSVVSEKIAWISGKQGTYAQTTDGGKTWNEGAVPGADELDFRDVEAFGESTAYLLSIGPGGNSRIYKTADAGRSWILQFKNPDPEAFFDAIAFWDDRNGVALSDPVQGQFRLVITEDGGANWRRLEARNMPPALAKESAFAASGTCLVTQGENDVLFCTGGAVSSRVFRSGDRGQNWTVVETPMISDRESGGIFSLAFRDRNRGLIVGGDYRKPNEFGANAACTTDGGKTWTRIEKPFPFRSCVAWARDRWIVVGTSGSDYSLDGSTTWKAIDQQNYNSVGFDPTGNGWAVGPGGRVARFVR